jgi:hypothetical protein
VQTQLGCKDCPDNRHQKLDCEQAAAGRMGTGMIRSNSGRTISIAMLGMICPVRRMHLR